MSKPWPQVDDADPKAAAWRQAVEERMDSGFQGVMDELEELKEAVVATKAAIEARRSFVDLAVHALDAPNTKYFIIFAVIIAMGLFGSGMYITWGDLQVGKDAPATEADADVDI